MWCSWEWRNRQRTGDCHGQKATFFWSYNCCARKPEMHQSWYNLDKYGKIGSRLPWSARSYVLEILKNEKTPIASHDAGWFKGFPKMNQKNQLFMEQTYVDMNKYDNLWPKRTQPSGTIPWTMYPLRPDTRPFCFGTLLVCLGCGHPSQDSS